MARDTIERANHGVAPVVAVQLRRHGGRRAGEEEVEQEGVDEIVAVVPQRHLVAAQVDGRVVEHAPAQAAAQGALGLPRLQLVEHDGVRVFFQHAVRVPFALKPALEQVAGEARVALIEVDGDQLELHRGATLQQAQPVEHGVRVLAT